MITITLTGDEYDSLMKVIEHAKKSWELTNDGWICTDCGTKTDEHHESCIVNKAEKIKKIIANNTMCFL